MLRKQLGLEELKRVALAIGATYVGGMVGLLLDPDWGGNAFNPLMVWAAVLGGIITPLLNIVVLIMGVFLLVYVIKRIPYWTVICLMVGAGVVTTGVGRMWRSG